METTATTAPKTRLEILAHETVLGELAVADAWARAARDSARDGMHFAAGDRRVYGTRSRAAFWPMSTPDAVAACAARAEKNAGTYIADDCIKAVATYTAAVAAADATTAAVIAHEEGYEGWTRFYLVPGGHIHRETRCPSLRPTTRIGWRPEMSGLTDAEAVEAHGPAMCSKCFRGAPVEWLQRTKLPRSAAGYADTTVANFG